MASHSNKKGKKADGTEEAAPSSSSASKTGPTPDEAGLKKLREERPDVFQTRDTKELVGVAKEKGFTEKVPSKKQGKGSHTVYRNPDTGHTVSIPKKDGDTQKPGTFNEIMNNIHGLSSQGQKSGKKK